MNVFSQNNFFSFTLLTKGIKKGIIQGIRKGIKRGIRENEMGEMGMSDRADFQKIAELTEQIGRLPKGYISKKIVGGKTYYYHQWSEGGEKKSKYLRDDELAELTERIELRKRLQKELADVKGGNPEKPPLSPVLKCTLMHKRIPVADLELDNETGLIGRVSTVYAPEHLPVGVGVKKGVADRAALNIWWTDRSIPASRSGVREALETLEIRDTRMLLIRCFGLSLSDQYWIRPDGSGLEWEAVNFFQNGFSDDIGDVLFGADKKPDPLNFSSPDNTSDGNLKKRWKIIDGKRCLVKGGSNPYRQQPLNEVIATEIMRRLGIPCVPYTVTWNKSAPYSVCEDFIDENTELVPAWRILQTKKQPNNLSLYQHFVSCAEELGIPGVRAFLDRMIVLDYIIANEDRHLNNFGAVREAETLKWIGMAPIYDSGSSLGYDQSAAMLRDGTEVVCKPFKKHHTEQLKLVSSFDWIDFKALVDAGKMVTGILSDENAKDFMEENRIRLIAAQVEQRIRNLETLAKSRTSASIDTKEGDVERNVAASYEKNS